LANSPDSVESAPKIHPDVTENWLASTLEQAADLRIPGVLQPHGKVTILTQYGLNREALHAKGCSREGVDRLYRAMFVYSVGFYQMIESLMQGCKNNFVVASSVWKTFIILLEYCNKVDYRTLISSMSMKHQRQMDEAEVRFDTKIDQAISHFDEREVDYKSQIADLQKTVDESA